MAANMAIKLGVIFLLFFVAFGNARKLSDFVDALTWLQSMVKNSTWQQFAASAVSPPCAHDLNIWSDSLKKQEMWAVESQCKSCACLNIRMMGYD